MSSLLRCKSSSSSSSSHVLLLNEFGLCPITSRFRNKQSHGVRELFSDRQIYEWKRYFVKKRSRAPPRQLTRYNDLSCHRCISYNEHITHAYTQRYVKDLVEKGQVYAASKIQQGKLPDPKKVETVRHIFSGGVGTYVDPELSDFFASLFKEIRDEAKIKLHTTDLYHGHIVLYPVSKTEVDIAILFHAKEFPLEYVNSGKKIHPVGAKEMGGQLDPRIGTECSIEDEDYHLRNFVYTLKSNRICALDPKHASFPRDLLASGPSGDVFYSVNQFSLGVYLGDVNYFPHLDKDGDDNKNVFLSLAHSRVRQAYSADRCLFAIAMCESILDSKDSEQEEKLLRDAMQYMTKPELRCVMSFLEDIEGSMHGELYTLFRTKLNAVSEATDKKEREQYEKELKKLRDEQSEFLTQDEISKHESLFKNALRETSFSSRGVESFSAFRASNLLAVMSKRFRGPMTRKRKIKGAFKKTCPHVKSADISNLSSEFKLCVNPNCSSCCSGGDDDTFEWCSKYVCLTCKSYCCGRYVKGHMMKHAKDFGHALAMNLGDASVWCYECMECVDTFHSAFDLFRLKYAEAKHLTNKLVPLWVWNTHDVDDMRMALTILSAVNESCTRPDLALKAIYLVQTGKAKDLNEAICNVIDLSIEKSKIFFRQKTLAFTKTLLSSKTSPEKAKM